MYFIILISVIHSEILDLYFFFQFNASLRDQYQLYPHMLSNTSALKKNSPFIIESLNINCIILMVLLLYQESLYFKKEAWFFSPPSLQKARMGRQRKRVVTSDAPPHSRRDERPSAFNRKEKKKKTDIGKVFINISIGLCIFSLIWFFYALYMRSSLSKRVVTLHPSPRVLDANSTTAKVSSERFWGSYRPQVYFGMKTRSPRSIVTGSGPFTLKHRLLIRDI